MRRIARWYKHSIDRNIKAGRLLLVFGFFIVVSFLAGMHLQASVDSQRQNVLAQDGRVSVPDIAMETYPELPAASAGTSPGNPPLVKLPISRSYVSASTTYVFTLYKQSAKNLCTYTLAKYGRVEDISALLHTDTVPCKTAQDGVSSGFRKWLDDQSFLFEINGKVLKIDASRKTAEAQ